MHADGRSELVESDTIWSIFGSQGGAVARRAEKPLKTFSTADTKICCEFINLVRPKATNGAASAAGSKTAEEREAEAIRNEATMKRRKAEAEAKAALVQERERQRNDDDPNVFRMAKAKPTSQRSFKEGDFVAIVGYAACGSGLVLGRIANVNTFNYKVRFFMLIIAYY